MSSLSLAVSVQKQASKKFSSPFGWRKCATKQQQLRRQQHRYKYYYENFLSDRKKNISTTKTINK